MRKSTTLFTIILAILFMFFTIPAMAYLPNGINADINVQGAIGTGNVGLQTNSGAIHHNTINTGSGGGSGSAVIEEGAVSIENSGNLTNTINNDANNSNTNKQNVVFNQTIEAAETKRDHHTGTAVTFASLGTYSESKHAGANFQSATIMTMFKDVFSYEGALEVYGKQFGKGLCETVGKSYNGRHLDNPSNKIKVYTMDDKIDPSTIKSIGFLTVKGVKGQDATSFTVLQKCILSACNMQGDAIIVTKEGAETITKSSGWGVGFNTSGSQINDNANGRGNSYAGSGGTGYSSGTGSLEILPWITVQVLKYK